MTVIIFGMAFVFLHHVTHKHEELDGVRAALKKCELKDY